MKAVEKLDAALIDGTLEEQLTSAFKFTQMHVSTTALGLTCKVRDAKDPVNEHQLISGTASQLNLSKSAIVDTPDVARMRYIFDRTKDTAELRPQIGTIVFNVDTWADRSQQLMLERVNKDGEIAALCLLIHWAKADDDAATLDALSFLAADLVFECRACGVGSRSASKTMQLIEADDANRKVVGMSAWRKAFQFARQLGEIQAEGRKADVKSDADRLLAVLKEDKVYGGEIKPDTMQRYLNLSNKLQHTELKKLLMKWESLEGRDSLIDSVTALRHIANVAPNTDDLEYLLYDLFVQQRCGLRKSIDVSSRRHLATPAQIARSILLRRTLWMHLDASFPELKSVIEPYKSSQFLFDKFGIDADGERTKDAVTPQHDSDEDGGDDDDE